MVFVDSIARLSLSRRDKEKYKGRKGQRKGRIPGLTHPVSPGVFWSPFILCARNLKDDKMALTTIVVFMKIIEIRLQTVGCPGAGTRTETGGHKMLQCDEPDGTQMRTKSRSAQYSHGQDPSPSSRRAGTKTLSPHCGARGEYKCTAHRGSNVTKL